MAETQAPTINLEDLSPKMQQPSGYLSLDKHQQKGLRTFIERCQIDKKNLASTTTAYTKCTEKSGTGIGWWQTPIGVISIGLGGLALGLLAAGAK